jgi:TP901 family phage tail tape measure protein
MATNTEKIVVQVVVKGEKDLNNLNSTTNKAKKGVGGLVKQYGLLTAGVLGAVAAFRQINQIIGKTVRTFRDYEFQMSKVRAITGANEKDFKLLSQTSQDLGRSTFFTAQQVAELQTNFGKLGFSTQEILNAQEATLQLATATDSDLGRAAIVAGAAVRGFGLDAEETQRVVDVMAVAFTSSALDIEKFQTSMTKVAPIAKAAGFSIEDTTAIMAQLSDAGIEASIAGTSLRNILLKMQDPNSDLVQSFGKTIHSLDELVPALAKFSQEGGSLAEIMEVVDLRQAAAFEQMITSRDRTVALRDALLDSNGAAKDMADIVGDNLEGAFKRLTSALQGLAIVILDSFVGRAITSMVEGLTNVVSLVNNFFDSSVSLNEAMAETAGETREQNIRLTEAARRYQELNNKLDRTNRENIELENILIDLQDELGNTVVEIDKETDALKLNKEELDKVITRTALLANKEALKLAHQIRNLTDEIEEENKVLDINEDKLRMQKLALIDAQSTTNDKFKDDQIYGHGLQMVTDAEGNQAELRREGNKVNQKTAEIQNKINETLKDKEAIQTVINTLEQDKANLEKLLIEQGFTMADVENLVAESRKKRSSETKKATKEEDALAKALDTVFDTLGRVLRKNQELEQKTFSALIDSAQSTANAIIQIEQNAADRRLKIDQDLLKSRLEGGLITQERYERELEKLDVKRFNQDKRLARAQALVNGALAITQVYAQTGAFAFAAVAPVIAATLAQVAVIESQQYAKGGLVHGKSHANGGEKFAVGGRVVELEGGEAVINKRSTSMFRSQLSAMNAAGGGVKFADGGLLNMPSFATNQFNAVGMNGLAGAMSQGGRVYVLESDITNTQNNVSLIQSQAGF